MNNARRRVGVLVGVLIAMCMCAMSGAACLTQSADPASDEERQVREWVERDIARAKAFVAAPENTHIKMVVTRGQAGTPEQVREYETSMASMRRAIEGKPDHPLREEMRTKWRFAPGASELASNELWIGTLGGLSVGRSSVTYHNDVLNASEREADLGDNGRVFWERIGMRSPLNLRARERTGAKEISANTGLAFEVLFGWFGIHGHTRTPERLQYIQNGDAWEVRGTVGNSQWTATVQWDPRTTSGFVSSREVLWTGVSGVRVIRHRNPDSIDTAIKNLRVEFLTEQGELRDYLDVREISVSDCSGDELRAACDVPAAGLTENDPVRGKVETHSVIDSRIDGNTSRSSPWTEELRASVIAAANGASERMNTAPKSAPGGRIWMALVAAFIVCGVGAVVRYSRKRDWSLK